MKKKKQKRKQTKKRTYKKRSNATSILLWILLIISIAISFYNMMTNAYILGYLKGMSEAFGTQEIDENSRYTEWEDYMHGLMNEVEEWNYYENYSSHSIVNCTTNECKAKGLYKHLTEDYVYEVGNDLDPMHTIRNGSGDCDEMSMLYMVLLKSVKISSEARCTYNHCFVRIYYDGKTIEADIASKDWREI